MCVSVYMPVIMYIGSGKGKKRALDPLELKL